MNPTIPAGAGEKMQYIVHPFIDNTIRFVLRYPCLLNADALRQAAFALVSSVDVLHASFIAEKRDAHWQVNSVCPADCFALIHTETEPIHRALDEALVPIAAQSPVQLHCTLVQGESECAVVLRISHLCADGTDGKFLLGKLCEAYTRMQQTGSCAGLEVKNGSRAVEQVYSQLSNPERVKLLKDPRTGIKSVFPFSSDDSGQPRVLWCCIPAEKMSALHDAVKHVGATVNDLLLTACYYAYAETAHLAPNQPMSIMSMMNLRRHCKDGDSEGLCNLTGALTTALPEGLHASFDATLKEIARQTRRSKEDPFAGLYGMPLLHGAANKLPLGLLLSAASHVYGSMSLGLTNVGNILGQALRMDGILPAAGWFGGPVKHKPGVQISAASFDGECVLSMWGYAAERDIPALQMLLDKTAEYACSYPRGNG